MMKSTFEVAKHPFEKVKMRLTRGMHEEADQLDNIGDIRAGEGEILKSAGKTAVQSGPGSLTGGPSVALSFEVVSIGVVTKLQPVIEARAKMSLAYYS